EIVEAIELEEEFIKAVPEAEKCFPLGEYRTWPTLVLQHQLRVCKWVVGEVSAGWQWVWGDWGDFKHYVFDKENAPEIAWGYRILETEKPIRNGHGSLVKFPSRRIPWLTVNFKTLFCDQAAWRFFEDYAVSWIEACPTYPGETGSCGIDDEVSERRRILLYPLGLDQVNRYGDPVAPIEVRITGWEFKYVNGSYGIYDCNLALEAVHSLPHKILDQLTSQDYLHSDDKAIERERAPQGIPPWGDGGEAGG
ncbi:unnamed protein product, partial [marine sediment metagenome]